jgi:hypothetical protein
MDERRAYLKELAARSADRWSAAPPPPDVGGDTRIETRNTIYQLRDGVCFAVTRRSDEGARMSPPEFIGMRLVGWLSRDNPRAGLMQDWRPGAYAVLWRARAPGEEHSAIALTSSTVAFRGAGRPLQSAPPPLPRRTPIPPRLPLPRPATPPAIVRPPVPSQARIVDVERRPEPPAPRARKGPPPLPARRHGPLLPPPPTIR